jgi:RNA polymerase sigma-70 factor, ECF subfamily
MPAVETAQEPQRQKDRRDDAAATLGDVLYADTSKSVASESDWVALVRSVGAGDQLALHALYERAHRIVFTLIVRITANRETAEELTVDVFHDLWRRASAYDPANGTVVGWIMNQARSRALDRVRFDSRKKRVAPNGADETAAEAPDACDQLQMDQQNRSLRASLAVLTLRSARPSRPPSLRD